ncbi:hypothetical protein DPMN_171140 [Dreissena polymorpha]|uniref:Uncharacterized protein n=1 Tax=Dreissena polymorpha TaxID=45954 RepID=A0A9D4E0P3_DREPO|nr:hypothetical protein DPMN_171140 [Dreissena polymorpha]
MDMLEPPSPPPTSLIKPSMSYSAKKEKLLKAWEAIRSKMLHTHIEEMSPATTCCVLCHSTVDNIIHCDTCGPNAFYCDLCCNQIHKPMLFHRPKKWNVGLIFTYTCRLYK